MKTVQRNLLKLQNDADITALVELAHKWIKKSDNEEVKIMAACVLRVHSYLSSLHLERYSFDRVIDEAVATSHRMLERAEKAEKQIKELEEQIEQYKLKEKLGL